MHPLACNWSLSYVEDDACIIGLTLGRSLTDKMQVSISNREKKSVFFSLKMYNDCTCSQLCALSHYGMLERLFGGQADK